MIGPHSTPPKWSTQLCGCGEEPITCFVTCCLPCVTFGLIAEIVDEGRTSCVAHGCLYGLLLQVSCHWVYSWLYRQKLRAKFGLPQEPCCDCCVTCCCEPCALCQEYAELKARGFVPSKGWIGPANAPPQMPPSMSR